MRSIRRLVMSSLLSILIETISKDLEATKSLEGKAFRKECNLLKKRIDGAYKLAANDSALLEKLAIIESKIKKVRLS